MKVREIRSKSIKYVLTYLIVGGLILMGARFFQNKSWFLGFFFFTASALVLYFYAINKKIPGKYLAPGLLLLFLFHIYPSIYSGYVSFTNLSNGHMISKTEAISEIISNSEIPVVDMEPVPYQAAADSKTAALSLIFQYPKGTYWLGNSSNLVHLVEPATSAVDGKVKELPGYRLLDAQQTQTAGSDLGNIKIQLHDGTLLQPQDFVSLQASRRNLVYSESKDEILNVTTGVRYRPDNNGQMVSPSGDLLYPGWTAHVGTRNFSSILTNNEIRRPLVAVLAWTVSNAVLMIFLSFLMGLFLSLIINGKHLRSRRFYRTIFITPMAIPSVISILVWAGLFTTDTGIIDRFFHLSIPWLTSATPARIAILIVEVWMTFPYMFLICTGAIQAIPSEIIEAAEIDGGSPQKIFRLIKLPLVLRTLAPLLITSMAGALNAFGVIFLLTDGNPIFSNSNGNAGATDILISYTYKLAFNGREGNNYGLASALSILDFFMVAIASIYGFRRMKTMEGLN